MPRFKKRRWKIFKRKVLAVSEKSLGSKTVLFNDRLNDAANVINNNGQLAVNVALYPFNSGTKTYLRDITRILNNDPDIGTSGKIIFQSGVLDMTCCNTSIKNPTSSPNASPPALEVDVYEIIAYKQFEKLGAAGGGDVLQVLTEGDLDTPIILPGNTSLQINDRGSTPFDFPSAISEYGLKILKKTKYFLSVGQTFTYQMRDPTRHVVDATNKDIVAGNIPKMTKWLFINHKVTPCTNGDESFPDVQSLSIGLSRKYMYKVNDKNEDRDAYNLT